MAMLIGVIGIFAVAMIAIFGMISSQLVTEEVVDEFGEPIISLAPLACNPDATQGPELIYAIQNENNKSATEYLAIATDVYKGTFTKENLPTADAYLGSFTTLVTGRPAVGSGFDATCGQDYTILVPASSASTSSGLFHMTVEENAERDTFLISRMTGLIARVKDIGDDGFVYAGTDLTAGLWNGDATTYYSTTGNITGDSDGKDIGTNGDFVYEIYLKTNSSVSTVARFNDQETTIAIDRASSADWDIALQVTFDGVNLIESKMANVPTRISLDQYEDAYLVPGNKDIDTSSKTLIVEMKTLSSINADDDIGVGIYTAGYTSGVGHNGAVYGYSRDDPTSTAVHTAFDMDFTMA